MKKALVILLALCTVGAAFAGDPAPELKVTEFKGDASVTLGVDLDNGALAFSNSANANVRLDIMGGGDKVTAGEGIWGELKIKTDGDPIRIKADQAGFTGLSGYKVIVDVALLHLADIASIGIKSGGTDLNYSKLSDMGAAFWKVDNTKYYGTSAVATLLNANGSVGPNAANGIVLSLALPKLFNLDVDFRSFDAWASDGTIAKLADADKNDFGLRAKLDLKAVDNLTVQAGVSTGFGGKDMIYDVGLGGALAYKYMLDDKMFVKPTVAMDAVLDNSLGTAAGSATKGTEKFGYMLNGGLMFGWGAKAKTPALYFMQEKDSDWGYYPGVSAGVMMTSKDVFGEAMGINASVNAGSLVPNLTAVVAFEMTGLEANAKKKMGLTANMKYALAMDPMTVTPKFGLYYYSDEGGSNDNNKTDIYVKAGLEIAKLFPNTSLTVEYASNDFAGGVRTPAVAAVSAVAPDYTVVPAVVGVAAKAAVPESFTDKALGMLTTTIKIAF